MWWTKLGEYYGHALGNTFCEPDCDRTQVKYAAWLFTNPLLVGVRK